MATHFQNLVTEELKLLSDFIYSELEEHSSITSWNHMDIIKREARKYLRVRNMVRDEKNKEALGIYGINVKENPDNWLFYADVANVYVKLSDKVNAILNYNKSLQLNKRSNNFEIQLYKEIQGKLKKLNE